MKTILVAVAAALNLAGPGAGIAPAVQAEGRQRATPRCSSAAHGGRRHDPGVPHAQRHAPERGGRTHPCHRHHGRRPGARGLARGRVRARHDYHAKATVRCTQSSAQPEGECEAAVVRRSLDGSATVEVLWPGGSKRRILFVKGWPVSSDSPDPVTVSRQDDLSVVMVGAEERFEILDALVGPKTVESAADGGGSWASSGSSSPGRSPRTRLA